MAKLHAFSRSFVFFFQRILTILPPETCFVLFLLNKPSNQFWVVVYRPYDCSVEETKMLLSCLDSVLIANQTVIMRDDFNVPYVNWDMEQRNVLLL